MKGFTDSQEVMKETRRLLGLPYSTALLKNYLGFGTTDATAREIVVGQKELLNLIEIERETI